MKLSVRKGFSFGLTSGIITTLGLIVGLDSASHSVKIIISGILIIALADSLSDALGIHMSEESDVKNTSKKVWESTISTFIFKLVFALSFIIPFLLFEISTGILISIIYGLTLLTVFSFYLAKREREKPAKIIFEHLLIAVIVIIATYFLGKLISEFFN
jgi:vacuolar iron transporter family protein